jgi:hypothetical protein
VGKHEPATIGDAPIAPTHPLKQKPISTIVEQQVIVGWDIAVEPDDVD